MPFLRPCWPPLHRLPPIFHTCCRCAVMSSSSFPDPTLQLQPRPLLPCAVVPGTWWGVERGGSWPLLDGPGCAAGGRGWTKTAGADVTAVPCSSSGLWHGEKLEDKHAVFTLRTLTSAVCAAENVCSGMTWSSLNTVQDQWLTVQQLAI